MCLGQFQLFLRKVTWVSPYFALFPLSAKCCFSTFEGNKASSSNYYNMIIVLYWLLPSVLQLVNCLGYACCQEPLCDQVKRVDLRLTLVANGIINLYRGYLCIVQFLYSCFNNFWIFCSRYLIFPNIFLFFTFEGGILRGFIFAISLILFQYTLFALVPVDCSTTLDNRSRRDLLLGVD